jgi:hypothetical protein
MLVALTILTEVRQRDECAPRMQQGHAVFYFAQRALPSLEARPSQNSSQNSEREGELPESESSKLKLCVALADAECERASLDFPELRCGGSKHGPLITPMGANETGSGMFLIRVDSVNLRANGFSQRG